MTNRWSGTLTMMAVLARARSVAAKAQATATRAETQQFDRMENMAAMV
jgi:hypothetical protein